MEDWQEWPIRADRIAAELGAEIDGLENDFLGDEPASNLRGFWPRFRDLKERVRVAPAIKLDDKLALERRLRTIGSRAYKLQEASLARSSERKAELLPRLEAVRAYAANESSPRELRGVRRDLDALRKEFDSDQELAPADRQELWETWRSVNQFVWDRVTARWAENETVLRNILGQARQDLERGNANAARQNTRRFFETLKTHEAKQEVVGELKADADAIRREAEEVEERKTASRTPSVSAPQVNALDSWRSELERNRDSLSRLTEEVAEIEQRVNSADSILEQAMLRGSLVDKRKKVVELERANRRLEQRIGQTEESPLIPTG
jgi:hypothetical protein